MNKIRNRKLRNRFPNENFIELGNQLIVLLGDEYSYKDDNGNEWFSGHYKLLNNKFNTIGTIKYIVYSNLETPYTLLCDIEINRIYRKQGL